MVWVYSYCYYFNTDLITVTCLMKEQFVITTYYLLSVNHCLLAIETVSQECKLVGHCRLSFHGVSYPFFLEIMLKVWVGQSVEWVVHGGSLINGVCIPFDHNNQTQWIEAMNCSKWCLCKAEQRCPTEAAAVKMVQFYLFHSFQFHLP